MVWRWILIGSVMMVLSSCLLAQPKVTVQGSLKGYFLSPDGNLSVYEVPFSFPEKPSSSDLPRRLFPLWAGYYLQAGFSATEKPIQSIWLLSGNGRLLWRRHYPEGVTEGTIPYQADGWVGVKGQDGLFVKLLVRFDDGSEKVVRPHFPVYFEKVLPLKVDWLDFVRIAEVANLLKEKGKEIWEGFSLEGIPFLLEGGEGQWVLINHPKPPKGFVRYKGPLPKVPFKMTVYVGEAIEAKAWREEATGRLLKVNGVWTATLRYFPNWWVLEDHAPIGYTVTREPDAVSRLETIVHEAFHVWWFQRVREPKTEGRGTKSQAIVLRIAEGESLARALEEKGELEKRRWTKAFLALRQKRRQAEGVNSTQVMHERWKEITEGVATFVSWRAMELGQSKDYQPIEEMGADNSFYGYQEWHSREKVAEIVAEALRQEIGSERSPYALGLAQTLLLSQWRINWQSQLVKGESLEEALAKVLKDTKVPSNLLAEVELAAEKLFRRIEISLHQHPASIKPPEQKVAIWFHFPDAIETLKWLKEKFGEVLPPMRFPLSGISVRSTTWIWLMVDESARSVGLFWDANKQLIMLHQPNRTVTLQGDGLEVQGNLQVSWDINGVHVRPDEKPQKATKEGASTMLRRKAWYAVVLPVALLAAIASRDTKALQEQETITIQGTITGVFLNPVTGQFEKETLPLPTDVYLSEEEEYQLDVTIASGSSSRATKASQTTFTLYLSLGYCFDVPREPCSYPKRTIALKLTPDRPKIGDNVIEVQIKWENGEPVALELVVKDEKENKERGRLVIGRLPAKGQLLIKAVLDDAEGEKPQPLGDVRVDLWYRNSKTQWVKKTETPVQLGTNGELLLCRLAPGLWRIVGYKGKPIPACPQVTEETEVKKDQPNFVILWFYLHKGIKGRVMEQTSGGQVPLPGANAFLYKGTDQFSGPWESGSDGYFFIPPFPIDGILGQYGSGIYTVKVVPPSRSMMKPEPLEATKDVTLTKCERTNPGDPCPRSLTIDIGTFVFTYKPAYPGPGGQ